MRANLSDGPDAWPSCVPELLVTSLAESLAFWCGVLGFKVVYDRPEARFAMLALHGGWVMLDQLGDTRDWLAGPLERPFGRGLNLEFDVPDVAAIHAAVLAAGAPVFLPMEQKHYRVVGRLLAVRQFIVADPDGYLLRFSQRLHDDG
jgi:catechol 2,3-dioxygenase-like lactoylglutathione lyase family enzyme